MKVHCSRCSEMHDISIMEPSATLPDCIVDMSPDERAASGVLVSKDICAIRATERGLIRVVLPIPIKGHATCNWGVWVELYSYDEFLEAVELWTDEALLKKTYAGKLANELHSYPGSLGFAGTVSFTSVKSVGRFEPAGYPHPELSDLMRDYYEGVTMARKLEWLLPMFHAIEPAS